MVLPHKSEQQNVGGQQDEGHEKKVLAIQTAALQAWKSFL